MKIFYSIILCLSFFFVSCEDYLYKTVNATVDENEIFGTYDHFQGYVDNLYYGLVDYLNKSASSMDFADDVVSRNTGHLATYFIKGNYNNIWSTGGIYGTSITNTNYDNKGVWDEWSIIRAANLGLLNLERLSEATQEEKDKIKGQMLFFRAYAYFELTRAWGGLPYIKEYLYPNSNMKLERLSLKDTFLEIANDLKDAEALLPDDWDPGLTGVERINEGRITKNIALAMYARTMLYLASPWIEGLANNNPENQEYNKEYCLNAATAALKVINSGKYQLCKWSDYRNNFATNNTSEFDIPWTSETILQVTNNNRDGLQACEGKIGALYMPIRFGASNCMSPTVEFVKMFDTQNGLEQQDDPSFNKDGKHPWSNLDPRFRVSIATDGMKWVKKSSVKDNTFQLYNTGGSTATGAGLDMAPSSNGSITGYIIRKFSCYGVNKNDGYSEYKICCPLIRLSEMYLTYAEAANELGGPNYHLDSSDLTAVGAINKLRHRVLLPKNEDMTKPIELEEFDETKTMPDIDARYLTSKEVFREKIRKERTIELAFEGHRWHDIRRWLIGHKLPKVATGLNFDKNHTSFEEVTLETRIFDFPKHYLLPFKSSDTELYSGFKQNPGWENK